MKVIMEPEYTPFSVRKLNLKFGFIYEKAEKKN